MSYHTSGRDFLPPTWMEVESGWCMRVDFTAELTLHIHTEHTSHTSHRTHITQNTHHTETYHREMHHTEHAPHRIRINQRNHCCHTTAGLL